MVEFSYDWLAFLIGVAAYLCLMAFVVAVVCIARRRDSAHRPAATVGIVLSAIALVLLAGLMASFVRYGVPSQRGVALRTTSRGIQYSTRVTTLTLPWDEVVSVESEAVPPWQCHGRQVVTRRYRIRSRTGKEIVFTNNLPDYRQLLRIVHEHCGPGVFADPRALRYATS